MRISLLIALLALTTFAFATPMELVETEVTFTETSVTTASCGEMQVSYSQDFCEIVIPGRRLTVQEVFKPHVFTTEQQCAVDNYIKRHKLVGENERALRNAFKWMIPLGFVHLPLQESPVHYFVVQQIVENYCTTISKYVDFPEIRIRVPIPAFHLPQLGSLPDVGTIDLPGVTCAEPPKGQSCSKVTGKTTEIGGCKTTTETKTVVIGGGGPVGTYKVGEGPALTMHETVAGSVWMSKAEMEKNLPPCPPPDICPPTPPDQIDPGDGHPWDPLPPWAD